MGTHQENFCIEKGYAHDAEVIYGDTDSAPRTDGNQHGCGYFDPTYLQGAVIDNII